MDTFGGIDAWTLVATALIYVAGGFVKGLVGFALPLVAVTGAASLLPAETAVAAIIIPVLVTNLMQAFREGVGPLLETARRFWALNLVLGAMIVVGAHVLPGLDERIFFLILGVVTLSASSIQLIGWRPRLSPELEKPVGLPVGVFAGFIGGLSGIWGPPLVLFLNALPVTKREHMRATGLAFSVGALILVPAHLTTGVLNAETTPLSLALCLPALLGMGLGRLAEGKLDPDTFRTATLVVLVIASLNLLRRAAIG